MGQRLGEPRPVSSFQPLTPPMLEHVIRKCLAKDPDDRWQSAHDVAEELRWTSEAGSQAGVALPAVRRRQTRATILWVSCGVLAVVAIGITVWLRRRRDPKYSSMPSEFELIARYFARPTPGAVLGPGDDCALIACCTCPGSTIMFSAAACTGTCLDETAACGDTSPPVAPSDTRFDASKRFAVSVPPQWKSKTDGSVVTVEEAYIHESIEELKYYRETFIRP